MTHDMVAARSFKSSRASQQPIKPHTTLSRLTGFADNERHDKRRHAIKHARHIAHVRRIGKALGDAMQLDGFQQMVRFIVQQRQLASHLFRRRIVDRH